MTGVMRSAAKRIDSVRIFGALFSSLKRDAATYNRLQLQAFEKGCFLNTCTEAPALWICVLPWPNIGDAYIVARYLESWANGRPYVALTYGQSSKYILEQCGIPTMIAAYSEVRGLVRLAYVLGDSGLSIKVLHYGPAFARITISRNLMGYKGTTYRNLIQDCVFPACETIPTQFPVAQGPSSESCFRKRLLILPHTNTLPAPPHEFWSEVINRCRALGLDVSVAPSAGSKESWNVPVLHFGLGEISDVLSGFNCVVAARSGLVDLMESLSIPKIVLYPKTDSLHDWGVGSALDAWSLKGSCKGLLAEMEISADTEEKTIACVIDMVCDFAEQGGRHHGGK